ncbi:5945_t:CDS:1, partial [Gigaspora rosea]
SEQGHRSSRTLKTDYIKAIQDLILTANKNEFHFLFECLF